MSPRDAIDPPPTLPDAPAVLSACLLAWYDRHRRVLPWRAPAGQAPDPYHVWLSEIMLQQTTVAAVAPRFARFLARWPSVYALAAAPVEEVMAAWAGLGYYARARNLYACARTVATRHGGAFPDSEDGLRALPGIGRYTAAAIAAIAFGRPAAAVDGNVERVVARLADIAAPMPQAKPMIGALTRSMVPLDRPGDFAQAMMDLGATLCTPRSPACGLCPWSAPCRARRAGTIDARPAKPAKAARPVRHGAAFWLACDGWVLLVRRPQSGLLGGMLALPSTDWRSEPWTQQQAVAAAPAVADWRPSGAGVRHVFTHFSLALSVYAAECAARPALPEALWVPQSAVLDAGLPTAMAKAAKLVLAGLSSP
ncbi:MAG: A/G-specific adenine glycosylase [Alphaproteobacteria bacterium]